MSEPPAEMDGLPVVDMRAVADRAGVALSSVSRVLSNHPDVSSAMRERVMAASRDLGYQPNLVAKSLRQGPTRTIGFVVRDISNPVFADIVKAAETTLREAGYSMLLANSEGDPDLDAQHIRLFRQRRADGLIVSLGSETHAATLEMLSGVRKPIVLLDREVPAIAASAVLCDHEAGVAAAVSDLISLGHKHVGFIVGPLATRNSRERLRGYRQAHHDAGVAVTEQLVRVGPYSQDFASVATQQLMSSPQAPTAIVAAGYQLALGTLSALQKLRLRIGRDVGFVACDETEMMRLFDPPISVVSRDTYRMGQLAAQLLLEALIEGKPPRVEVLPTQYVRRESSCRSSSGHGTSKAVGDSEEEGQR